MNTEVKNRFYQVHKEITKGVTIVAPFLFSPHDFHKKIKFQLLFLTQRRFSEK
jgi:hypothetical protein